MGLPAIIFYRILYKNALRIPFGDDYDVILALVNRIHQTPDLASKLLYSLAVEHNGYKLMFENAIVLGQYGLFGQVYFLPLVALGDAFALFIFLVVCSMSRVEPQNLANRALLLVPAAFLLFQLQYASTLDFASTSLQQLPVIFFSLLSIALLASGSRWSFPVACVALVLGIASSPNGFFVAPVGILMMLQARYWRRVPVWIATTGLMLAVYLFKYVHPPSTTKGSAGSLTHFNVLYALSFLGSSAARYVSLAPSLTLGLVLCAIFAITIRRGYFRKNPAVFYSMLFILINAAAISGLRSDLGLEQSLASRYRTYSNLFLVFSYMFVIEDLLPMMKSKSLRYGVLAAIGALSGAFCALSDVAGARFLAGKKLALTRSYCLEWKKEQSPLLDAGIKENPALRRQIEAGFLEVDIPTMQESVRLGVYRPPQDRP